MDPDPRIHLARIVDPDPDPRIHLLKIVVPDPGSEWIQIRIRVPHFEYELFSLLWPEVNNLLIIQMRIVICIYKKKLERLGSLGKKMGKKYLGGF